MMPVSQAMTLLARFKEAFEVLLHQWVRQEAKGSVRQLSSLPDPAPRKVWRREKCGPVLMGPWTCAGISGKV